MPCDVTIPSIRGEAKMHLFLPVACLRRRAPTQIHWRTGAGGIAIRRIPPCIPHQSSGWAAGCASPEIGLAAGVLSSSLALALSHQSGTVPRGFPALTPDVGAAH